MELHFKHIKTKKANKHFSINYLKIKQKSEKKLY